MQKTAEDAKKSADNAAAAAAHYQNALIAHRATVNLLRCATTPITPGTSITTTTTTSTSTTIITSHHTSTVLLVLMLATISSRPRDTDSRDNTSGVPLQPANKRIRRERVHSDNS